MFFPSDSLRFTFLIVWVTPYSPITQTKVTKTEYSSAWDWSEISFKVTDDVRLTEQLSLNRVNSAAMLL